LQDNGSWRGPSSVWQDGGIRNHHWQMVGFGDGFETLPDPRDSTQGYSLWQGGNLMRWNARTGETKIVKPAPGVLGSGSALLASNSSNDLSAPPPQGTKLRFNWNAALAIDPLEPGTVYLGSQFVHRSRDRGDTWETISPDLTTNNPEWQKQDESGGLTRDVTAAENHTTLVSIAPSPVERGVIWAGSDDGRLHVTRDGGRTWSSVEKAIPGVPANTWIPHIEASPHQGGTAFVVFDNHRRSDWTPYAYRSDDYGRTWTSLASKDLRGYCLVVRQDPVKKELLFLGTEFGLYASFDGGARWTHLKKTLPTASVMDLAIHPREHDLVIGTHGRALFVLDDLRPLRAMSEAVLKEPLRLFEVPDAQQYWPKPDDGGFGFGAGEFRGPNRPYGAMITYSLNLPGLPLQDEDKEKERKERERQEKRRAEASRPAEAKPGEKPPAAGAAPEPKPAEPKSEAEKALAEEEPKVEITVSDSSGKTIRTFKAPARLGVNRAAWNLRRDALKQLPRREDAPPLEEEPSGPEVPPGTYTVNVRYEAHESKQTVKVLADPRSRNTAEDWQRRWDAIQRAAALADAAAEAVWRIRRTRDDVGVVDRKLRQRAEDAGEKDKKKIEEQPLVKAGARLKEGLDALEKRLWASPETKGIVAETDVLSQVFYPLFYIQSSWDPPTPTHLEFLRQGEARLNAYLADLGAFFDKDVAAYRSEVEAARIGLLAATP
jgi:hypothetical protein